MDWQNPMMNGNKTLSTLEAPGVENGEPEVRAQRFAQIVDYALRMLGAESGTVVSTQRQLADFLGCSETMIHRYRTARVDFWHLKAATIWRLGQASRLHVGALFTWVLEGREAAMAYERAFTGVRSADPLILAEELVVMLKHRHREEKPQGVDYELLRMALAAKCEESPALFRQLVKALSMEPCLQKVDEQKGLDEACWQGLASLLDEQAMGIQERYAA